MPGILRRGRTRVDTVGEPGVVRRGRSSERVQTEGVTDHDHTNIPGDGGALTAPLHDAYDEFYDTTNPGASPAGRKRIWSQNLAGKQFLTSTGSDGLSLVLARDNVLMGRNVTGAPLTKGTAVHINGAATGNFPHLVPAQANSLANMPALGLIFEDIPNNGFGRVMIWGRLQINTTAWNEGDRLWVSATTPGALTNVEPASPNIIQRVGIVAVQGVGNGAIVITQTAAIIPTAPSDIGAVGALREEAVVACHAHILRAFLGDAWHWEPRTLNRVLYLASLRG